MEFTDKIEKLKLLTSNEPVFSVAFEYFVTHFTENPAVIQNSKIYNDKINFFSGLLKPLVNKIMPETEVSNLFIMQMENYHFIHGVLLLSNGIPIAFYYFEDLFIGMVAVATFDQGTSYYRISGFYSDKIDSTKIIPTKISHTLH